MKFRPWLENDWGSTTVDWEPDPDATQSWHPNQNSTSKFTGDATVSNPRYGVPDDATLAQIAAALKPLAFDSIESGFAGTPDFAAPEQIAMMSNGSQIRHPDFYHSFLKEIAQIFPDMAEDTKAMLDNWMLFRQEVLRRLGKKSYMDSGKRQLRPTTTTAATTGCLITWSAVPEP